MPKKRRRPRSRPRTPPVTGTVGGGTEEERRETDRPIAAPGRRASTDGREADRTVHAGQRSRAEKKELARRARDAAVKSVRRRRAARRALQVGVLAAVVLGVFLFLTRVGAPGDVPEAALRAAEAAGCGDVQTPTSGTTDRTHLAPGETFTYEQRPATSGAHAPAPLPAEPQVYAEPVDETAAVHNLEHAYVLIYYRADGGEALAQDVVDELEQLAESETKVIMAPHPSLEEGTSLALAAWNKLWECPSGVGPAQARTIASGFIEAYRGTSNAPEPQAG